MAKKVNKRRRRIKKANHGARPCTGCRKINMRGTGKK